MARIRWRKDKSVIFLVIYEAKKWSMVIKVKHKTHCFCSHPVIHTSAIFMFDSFKWGRYGSGKWDHFISQIWSLFAGFTYMPFFLIYLGGWCILVQNICVWKRSIKFCLSRHRVVSSWELEVLSSLFLSR